VVLARLAPGAAPLLLLPGAVPHRSGARAAAAANQRGATAAAVAIGAQGGAFSIGLDIPGAGGRRDGLTRRGSMLGLRSARRF
jgi:hypothetical protein